MRAGVAVLVAAPGVAGRRAAACAAAPNADAILQQAYDNYRADELADRRSR